jgi:hypothetical protein
MSTRYFLKEDERAAEKCQDLDVLRKYGKEYK